jgi:hypothetical protein
VIYQIGLESLLRAFERPCKASRALATATSGSQAKSAFCDNWASTSRPPAFRVCCQKTSVYSTKRWNLYLRLIRYAGLF